MAACTILAGPNGSGKSSFFSALSLPGQFINADIIARRLDPSKPERASFAAGKLVLRELADAVRAQQDFIHETTLSSNQSIELIRRALDAGYEIGLVFVALRDADLHVARVAQRVSEGGHDIAESVIRRRYESSLARLGDAVRLVHGTMIYDNSSISGPTLLLQVSNGRIDVNNLDETTLLHRRIGAVIGEAFDLSRDVIFPGALRKCP